MSHDYTFLMSIVLDGQASADETAYLQQHLQSCRPCSEAWQTWRALDRRLSSSPRLDAPPGLEDRVMARVFETTLARRRAAWLIGGSLGGLVSLAVSVAIWAGLAAAGIRGAGIELARLGSVLDPWISALGVFVRSLWVAAEGLGVPTVAGSVGLLACATCFLGALWLWLLGRQSVLRRPAGVLDG